MTERGRSWWADALADPSAWPRMNTEHRQQLKVNADRVQLVVGFLDFFARELSGAMSATSPAKLAPLRTSPATGYDANLIRFPEPSTTPAKRASKDLAVDNCWQSLTCHPTVDQQTLAAFFVKRTPTHSQSTQPSTETPQSDRDVSFVDVANVSALTLPNRAVDCTIACIAFTVRGRICCRCPCSQRACFTITDAAHSRSTRGYCASERPHERAASHCRDGCRLSRSRCCTRKFNWNGGDC